MTTLSLLICFAFASTLSTIVTGLSTIPHVENGGTVVLARRENETNVTIFCRVSNNGSAFGTSWFLRLPGEAMENQIRFNNPNPTPNFVRVGATSNLTIELFSRNLNMAVVRCTNFALPLEEASFLLRIIG